MVDLDELDRLHASLPELEATSWPDVYKEDSDVAVVIATIRDSEEWPHLVAEGLAVASVTILNAYPALAAEVRALREVADAARDLVDELPSHAYECPQRAESDHVPARCRCHAAGRNDLRAALATAPR